jgi:hypothetical protein
MSIVYTPEESKSKDHVPACSMANEKRKSLAEECTQLSLDSTRITIVKSDTKYAK